MNTYILAHLQTNLHADLQTSIHKPKFNILIVFAPDRFDLRENQHPSATNKDSGVVMYSKYDP